MKTRFRRGHAIDLDHVEAAYTKFLLEEQGREQPWTVWKLGVYPTRSTAEEALDWGELYVLEEEDSTFLASVILNCAQPPEYAGIPWRCPVGPEEAMVIHTLCIDPDQAGRGVGKETVRRILEEAKAQGCKAVRLDTGGQNKPAVGLYQRMGFTLASAGAILLDGQIPHENHVFMEYPL